MRLGIVAMGLESARDFRSAGVARYGFGLLDALADPEFENHELHYYLLPSFNPPPSWRSAKHVRLHQTWKRYNKWTLLASGFAASLHGLDFLLTTANTIPLVSRVPTGVFIHDLFPLDHPEWFPAATADVNERTIPRAVRASRLVLANSESTKRDVLRHFPVDERKVAVTALAGGNPIRRLTRDQVDRNRLRALGVGFDRYLLTLSTIEPRKNLGRLLEAFAKVVAEPGLSDVGLVVAGSKGWKYEEALAKVDLLGLQDRVVLPGYVDEQDLPHLFGGCEAYVCPSLSEGFGMPLVEAMAAGAPVLSSSGGALPEVGGEAARYFDPFDVASMSRTISDALRAGDRDVWIQASLAGAEKFSWRRTALSTLAAIEQSRFVEL